jgi:AcrR family transcriptional regulator
MEDSYHHGALRQALVAAALELLEEGQALSLRAVARRAGVSHAAPYHHFADRRALLAAVAAEGMALLREAVLVRASGSGQDAGARLLAAGAAYVRFALQRQAIFRLIFSAELASREGLPELKESYASVRGMLFDLTAGFLGPDADDDEVRVWALRGWSLVHGLANLILDEQVPGVRTPADVERVTRKVLLAGLPIGSS